MGKKIGSLHACRKGQAPTLAVGFAPNLLIRQGAKLVTNAEDVFEELHKMVRAALAQAEQRNLLISASFTGSAKNLQSAQRGVAETD